MKKNKGFTIVELIAILVVLTIVLMIAVPTVLNTMQEYDKNRFLVSSNTLVKQAESSLLTSDKVKVDALNNKYIRIEDMKSDVNNLGEYTGIITNVKIGNINNYYITITDGKFYACNVNIEKYTLDDIKERVCPTFVKKVISTGIFTNSTFLITNDNKVYAVSNNTDKKLGNNNTFANFNDFIEITGLSGLNIVDIQSSSNHTIFLSNDGDVYSAGNNNFGQLGHGDTAIRNTVEKITALDEINIIDIAVLENYSVFLSSDGDIYTTGNNSSLNIGGSVTVTPTLIDKTVFNNYAIKEITSFKNSLFLIASNNNVYGIGNNTYGQLGFGDDFYNSNNTDFKIVDYLTGISIDNVLLENTYSIFLTSSNDIYMSGNNDSGHFGLGDEKNGIYKSPVLVPFLSEKNIELIQSGTNHTMFLTDSNNLYVSGSNNFGQLGNTNYSSGTATPIMLEKTLFDDEFIIQIEAHNESSYILTDKGNVYVFGKNTQYELGTGNFNNVYTPTKLNINF